MRFTLNVHIESHHTTTSSLLLKASRSTIYCTIKISLSAFQIPDNG